MEEVMQLNIKAERAVDRKEVSRLRGQLKTVNNKLDRLEGRKMSVTYNSFLEAKEFTSAYNDRSRLTSAIEEALESQNSINLEMQMTIQTKPNEIKHKTVKMKLSRKWCNDAKFIPEDKKKQGLCTAYQLDKEQILVEYLHEMGKESEIIRFILLTVGKTFRITLLARVPNIGKCHNDFNYVMP
jgi:hypothetical protein